MINWLKRKYFFLFTIDEKNLTRRDVRLTFEKCDFNNWKCVFNIVQKKLSKTNHFTFFLSIENNNYEKKNYVSFFHDQNKFEIKTKNDNFHYSIQQIIEFDKLWF